MRHPITESASVLYTEGDPLICYRQWINEAAGRDRLLLVDFSLTAYWLAGKPDIPLTALYLESGGSLTISVTNGDLREHHVSPPEQFARWSQDHGFVCYVLGEPVALTPLAIAKPWGREVWYTGVEERGVCCLAAGGGQSPIPWMQAVIPDSGLGVAGEALVLLKILDPVAEPVIGDLYFELHEEKQEVYVVTHVDKTAWPDGTGYIRMGFDERKLAGYSGDSDGFRAVYLEAVQRYETVRRKIDGLPEGADPGAELLDQELRRRRQMDDYSHLRPLRPGDVVKVPLLTPHALQHGVRTVEFQTPVYERKILSFAQQVLTQDHWDTQEAVAQMQLTPVAAQEFDTLEQQEGLSVERIVDFSDFEVRRVRLSGGRGLAIEALVRYGLVMIVEGQLRVAGKDFGPEQALILPRGWCGELAPAQPSCSLVFLLALPRQ